MKRGNDPTAIFADIFPIENRGSSTAVGTKDEYKDLLDTLSLKAEIECDGDGCDEIQLCLLQLKDIELRNKLNDILRAIKLEMMRGEERS